MERGARPRGGLRGGLQQLHGSESGPLSKHTVLPLAETLGVGGAALESRQGPGGAEGRGDLSGKTPCPRSSRGPAGVGAVSTPAVGPPAGLSASQTGGKGLWTICGTSKALTREEN